MKKRRPNSYKILPEEVLTHFVKAELPAGVPTGGEACPVFGIKTPQLSGDLSGQPRLRVLAQVRLRDYNEGLNNFNFFGASICSL